MGGPESRREGQRKSQAWLRKSCLDALAYDLDVWPRYDVNFYTSVIVGERYKPSTFRALTYLPTCRSRPHDLSVQIQISPPPGYRSVVGLPHGRPNPVARHRMPYKPAPISDQCGSCVRTCGRALTLRVVVESRYARVHERARLESSGWMIVGLAFVRTRR
jgi:hypothetical protein